jgi:hypothetical protein
MGGRMGSKSPWSDQGTLRDARNLLRYLAFPRRLRENPLAKRIWAAWGLVPDGAEANLVKCLEASIRASLGTVSPRQRVIIERCDLANELNVQVADDLGISIRHLYRERTAALVVITSHVASRGSEYVPATEGVPDTFAVQLSLVRTLEQNGHWIVAAEMLERLSSDLGDAERRCLVEALLTDLYIDAGRYSLAAGRVKSALELSANDRTGPAWLKAEAAVLAARLAIATGDMATGLGLARCSCTELRSWIPTSQNSRPARALLAALELCSRGAIDRGDSRAAMQLTSEALGVVRLQSPDAGALTAARLYAAMAQIIAGNPGRGECDLRTCYEDAIHAGQTRHALGVAVALSSYWRITARPSQSIELLSPLFQLASKVAFGDLLGGFLVELGSAAADARDLDVAGRCSDNLRTMASMTPWIRAHAEMLEARVAYANCRFEVSLRASEAAESGFITLGRARFVGPCLQLQSQSLAALGETERALRTMQLAAEQLEGTGQHYDRLIAAYLTMAALTGESKFKIKARRLRATFDASLRRVV